MKNSKKNELEKLTTQIKKEFFSIIKYFKKFESIIRHEKIEFQISGKPISKKHLSQKEKQLDNILKRIRELNKEYCEIIVDLYPNINELPHIENSKDYSSPLPVRIKLETRRGKRIDKEGLCDECKVPVKTLYQYDSNIGKVKLCYKCKEKLLEISFPKDKSENENLIGKRVLSGGAWETNRRKF